MNTRRLVRALSCSSILRSYVKGSLWCISATAHERTKYTRRKVTYGHLGDTHVVRPLLSQAKQSTSRPHVESQILQTSIPNLLQESIRPPYFRISPSEHSKSLIIHADDCLVNRARCVLNLSGSLQGIVHRWRCSSRLLYRTV